MAATPETVRTARATGLAYLGLALTGLVGSLLIRSRLFVDDPATMLANLTDHVALARWDVVLELGVVPTFATKWLLPRLAGFLRAHPGISVNLTPRTRPFLFDETPFHAAISVGPPGSNRLPPTTSSPLISASTQPARRLPMPAWMRNRST